MFGINGTEGNDSGALTPEQQSNLNEFKVNAHAKSTAPSDKTRRKSTLFS